MQLTKILVRDFRKDRQWILAMLSSIEKLRISMQLRKEPSEFLITLLMKREHIEKAVVEAAREVFGNSVTVSEISVSRKSGIINVTFSNNC